MSHDPAVFHFSGDNVLEAPPRCALVAVPELVNAVEHWCRRQAREDGTPPALVIDLSPVETWDMTVFRTLVWAKRRCLSARADVHLVLRSGTVFEPHEEAIVRDLFTVLDTVPTSAASSSGNPLVG